MNESYTRRGYAQPGYAQPEYTDRGYTERGYDRDGYNDRGYAEREYTDRRYDRDGYDRSRNDRDGYDRSRTDKGRTDKGGQKNTSTGGVLLAAISIFSACMVLWGLYYATGTSARHKVALAAAGCEPNLLSVNVECVTVHILNNMYKRVVNPVVQQVNADVADYNANERHDLTAAEAALRAEVTTENLFDKSLAKFPFPPSVAPKVKTLIQAIEAQAKLTAAQAQSSSAAQMRSFNGRVKVASAAVRTDLTLVRKTLEKPVTPAMEP
jgi:hypothetical protein